MSTLQEHLEDAYDVDIDEQIELHEGEVMEEALRQRFVIDDEDKATWALRKLARLKGEEAADAEQVRVEFDRITTWQDERETQRERQVAFFAGLLREYHEGELAKDPSKKSIKLPAGTLKSRAGSPKWTIDPDPFLEWFDNDEKIREDCPELVRVKREPALSAIKETFEPKDDRVVYTVTGEFVPGVTVEPGERTFKVEVAQ
jgi:hypothetical protein